MTEDEADVIEAAIEFIQHWDNGLYADRPKYLADLRARVSELCANNEGMWHRPDDTVEPRLTPRLGDMGVRKPK